MYTILVYSEKGGVGKSALSNALAYGASLIHGDDDDFEIVIAHMDNRQPILPQKISGMSDRGYAVVDLRDDKEAMMVIERAKSADNEGVLIIDVGANKTALVERFAPLCDLALIPMEGDYDSIRLAMNALDSRKMAQIPGGAFIVTNRTPAAKSKSRQPFEKHIEDVPPGSIFYHFPQLAPIADLARPEPLKPRVKSKLFQPAVKFYTKAEAHILKTIAR